MSLKIVIRVLAVAAVVLFLSPMFLFVVDERELAVVLRFGKPVREKVEPGVYAYMPMMETVRRLPKTRQLWGDHLRNLLPDLPTKDDKKIELIPWAIWQIDNEQGGPTAFLQRLITMDEGEKRIAQVCRSSIRDIVTQYDLAELVRSTSRKLPTGSDKSNAQTSSLPIPASSDVVAEDAGGAGEGEGADPTLPDAEAILKALDATENATPTVVQLGRSKILDEIKQEAQRRLASSEGVGQGIRLIDVGISQIAFVDSVRIKTFDRWVAEREAVSALNVNEGERLKSLIINQTNAEVQRIEGEGQRRASEIKGEADADVIRSYAEAIEQVGEFYEFVRTLEAYEKSISSDSRMILTTNSEFFGLLKRLGPTPKSLAPLAGAKETTDTRDDSGEASDSSDGSGPSRATTDRAEGE